MKANFPWTCPVLLLTCYITAVSLGAAQRGAQNNHEGYYPFQKAKLPYDRPPRVRKPPYHRANVHCPERTVAGRFSPRDTLCGDLNKGFIPRNPMGQRPVDDPYPFELIKKKALEFLSKALPFLQQDSNLPKVAKFVGKVPPSPPVFDFAAHPEFYGFYQPQHRRGRAVSSEPYSAGLVDLGIDNALTSANEINRNTAAVANVSANLSATARQLCQHGSGTLCTIMSALSTARVSTAVLQTILQLLSSRSPTISDKVQSSSSSSASTGSSSAGGTSNQGTLFNMLSYASDVLGAINPDSGSPTTTPAPPVGNRSPLTQVLTALTGATGSTTSSSSPLVTVLDLMTSDSSPIKLLANVYSNRRKNKPSVSDSIQGSVENDVVDGMPPTPCSSVEEYVTPTFARNYQGVWKYVVQIPQEGYLTQTVQQTKCMSTRCDFVDGGHCHESPRWVSLLVAEIFYPHAYFPTSSPSHGYRRPHERPRPSHHFVDAPPPVEEFHDFQQYLNRRVGGDHQNPEDRKGAEQRGRRDKRLNGRIGREQKVEGRRGAENSERPQRTQADTKEKCDGYDKVGCYVIRMYYDWFLVNGSCKCWKPDNKRLFTGRR